MADKPSSSKREEAKQLRKERLKAFRMEPARDGNMLIDLPFKSVTIQERSQSMNEKIDKILKSFPPLTLDRCSEHSVT